MNEFVVPKINFPINLQSIQKESASKKIDQEKTKDFDSKLSKVNEVKIYIKENFQASNVNENFVKKLELEYANLYLEKLGLPSKPYQIKKLLESKPLESCDFQINTELILKKNFKVLHILPNISGKKPKMNLQALLTNQQFENVINKTSQKTKEPVDEKLQNIKKRPLKNEEIYLFKPEVVENIINKAKEQWEDKKLSYESNGVIEQQVKGLDLGFENIRKKYIYHQYYDENGELKTKQFDKSPPPRDIVDSEKFQFPYLDINLNFDILKEVNKPVEIPIEVIMKDVNYIIDNFPIDKLLNIQEPIKNTLEINDIPTNDNKFNKMNSNYQKLNSIPKKDVLMAYKKMQSPHVYRIIGLLVNLIYWVIFGYLNKVQLVKNTKKQILLKILEEMQNFENSFKNKTKFIKIFMPIFILILRIECEAIFVKRFKLLLSDKKCENLAIDKINELITSIFDPNLFFQNFNFVDNEHREFQRNNKNKTFSINYKTRINSTSTLINQLFSTFANEMNVKKFLKGSNISINKNKTSDIGDLEEETKFIMDNKCEFYRVILNKINSNLKKRNMDPIFKVSKN